MQSPAQLSSRSNDGGTGFSLSRCLVEGDPESLARARRRRGETLAISLVIEIVLLVVLVATPLLSIARPQFHLPQPQGPVFLGTWHPTSPVQQSGATNLNTHPMIHDIFVLPQPVGETVRRVSDEESAEASSADFMGPGTPEGISIGNAPIGLSVEPPRIEKPEKPPQQEKRTVKISEGVLEAQLLSRPEPRYPVIAKMAKIEGTVVLHAIISTEGRITSLEVVSGPPLLVQAALDAVREWRYRPTMLSGQPVEVDTTITVIFRLQH